MKDRVTLKKHAVLLDGMSAARGIDLQERALAGDISIDALTDAVLSCTNCTNPEACAIWLEQNETAPTTPAYCENRIIFA